MIIGERGREIFDSMPRTPHMIIGSYTKGTQGMGFGIWRAGDGMTGMNTSSSRKLLAIEG
jgi:hypothetical protein